MHPERGLSITRCPNSCVKEGNHIIICGSQGDKRIFALDTTRSDARWVQIGSYPQAVPSFCHHSVAKISNNRLLSVEADHVSVITIDSTKDMPQVSFDKIYTKGSKKIQITKIECAPSLNLFDSAHVVIGGSSWTSEGKQVTVYAINKDNNVTRVFYDSNSLPMSFKHHQMAKVGLGTKNMQSMMIMGCNGACLFDMRKSLDLGEITLSNLRTVKEGVLVRMII